MSPSEQDRKMVDHESYTQQSLEKMNEEAMKQRREINYVPTQRNDSGHVPKTNLENAEPCLFKVVVFR